MSDRTDIPLLNQEQRQQAKDRAKNAVIASMGNAPYFEDYQKQNISEYPDWVNYLVIFLLFVCFGAAGTISLFRIFNLARDHFYSDIPVYWQSALVGLAVFLLGEFVIVVSSMASGIYKFEGRKRYFANAMIGGGLLITFVGNWTFTDPDTLFSIIEAIFPPLTVVGSSLILEELITQKAKDKLLSIRAFQQAQVEFEQKTKYPEKHPEFKRYWANAIQDTYKELYKRRIKIVEEFATFTDKDWIDLVKATLKADDWYSEAIQDANEQRTNERVRKPIHSFTERTNEYSDSEPLLNTFSEYSQNGHERTANAGNGYTKNMSAFEMADKYLRENIGRIDATLDELQQEISNHYGANVGRTSIHNARKAIKENI